MSGHPIGDILEYYSRYVGLKLLHSVAFLMWCIGWALEKSGPALLSWSTNLKSFVIRKLGDENNLGEKKEDSPQTVIEDPDQSENQSDWSGNKPKVQVTPRSTDDLGSPETFEYRLKESQMTILEDKTDFSEESHHFAKVTSLVDEESGEEYRKVIKDTLEEIESTTPALSVKELEEVTDKVVEETLEEIEKESDSVDEIGSIPSPAKAGRP